jgi:lysophospholipase L1-like esterase
MLKTLPLLTLVSLLSAACVSLPGTKGNTPIPAGSRYVAMGSSFASGPGVTRLADDRDPRCTRSYDNYARQTARQLQLELVDVSCGGATSDHVLNGWNELPPQVAALTEDTRLVTVTIGGNDVGYVAGLFAGSCSETASASEVVKTACAKMRQLGGSRPVAAVAVSDAEKWTAAEAGLFAIAAEVARRSPKARLVFVQYLTLLPSGTLCSAAPLSPAAAEKARNTAARLAKLTETVALKSGAEVLPIADISVGHDACAPTPWATAFVPTDPSTAKGFVPYHPNLDGMTAVADALIKKLR